MDTKKILIVAAISAAVTIAIDFILPIKVDSTTMTGTRFASKN